MNLNKFIELMKQEQKQEARDYEVAENYLNELEQEFRLKYR